MQALLSAQYVQLRLRELHVLPPLLPRTAPRQPQAHLRLAAPASRVLLVRVTALHELFECLVVLGHVACLIVIVVMCGK